MRRRLAATFLGLSSLLTMGCGETAPPPAPATGDATTKREDAEIRLQNPFNEPGKTPPKSGARK